MTTYIKQLKEQLNERYGELTGKQLIDKLFEIGVVDHRLCKVLAVREYVWALLKGGSKKTDAMWRAADHFCCTYEYVRKCMYYYTDLNFSN